MTIKEIFIENLSKIKGETTNYEIAEIMQCSTGTMSKYLNAEKYPNLIPPVDSLVLLCKHFNISMDWLLGIDSTDPLQGTNKSTNISIREFCRILSVLLEDRGCIFQVVNREEDCWESDPESGGNVDYHSRTNTYNAILFSNYFTCESVLDFQEAEQVGNYNFRNLQINTFIQKLLKAHDLLKSDGIDREMYNILLEKYLSVLPDEYDIPYK